MRTLMIVVDRKRSHPRSMGGDLSVDGKFVCHTLELPWRWNEKNVSCIPPGEYAAFLRYDKPDGWRIQLLAVPGGRTGVQIHVGNYPRQIRGCVLVGTSFASDAVFHSEDAYQLLRQAFYGSAAPNASPSVSIRVRFQGILTTPWGDFPDPSPDRMPA